MQSIDYRRQGTAKLMTEHRQEFILAAAQLGQGFRLLLLLALHAVAFGDVVEAIDRARDLSVLALEWPDVHDHRDPRAIRPLDDHFAVARFDDLAVHHLSHGALLVRHVAAVGAEQLERAAETFVGLSDRRLTAPQLRGAAVEV